MTVTTHMAQANIQVPKAVSSNARVASVCVQERERRERELVCARES
jgi:hypothetical protein